MSDATQRKLAVVRISSDLLIEVPQDYTKDGIESWLNDSCHCIGNEIRKLAAEDDMNGESCCFSCHRTTAEYLRDADTADIENLTPEFHPRRVAHTAERNG